MSDDSTRKADGDAGASPADQELSEAELAALEAEAPAVSALLKRSLATPDAAPPKAEGEASATADADRELLRGVQRKLRQRSKGKFYADGWSTSQSRMNYALIAGVMLVVIVAVYLALGPMGIALH